MKMEEGPDSQKEKGSNESNHKENDDTSKELPNQNPSVLLPTKVKGPKAKENQNYESNHKENNGTSKKKQKKNLNVLPATKVKALKQKKKDKGKQKSAGVGSHIFVQDEITNNKEASALISDLVKCYTCNCNLPKTELEILNKTLYEKTVTLFLDILNNCVEKVFNRLLGTDVFKEIFLSQKVVKKDVLCQTDVSYTDY